MEEFSVNNCSTCGRRLTVQEDEAFNPPTCINCAREQIAETKKQMIISIAISVVLMIVGIIVIRNPLGILLAGIPYGWAWLNKITPSIFLFLPIIGWVIYFVVKLVLSYAVGLIALPIKLYQWIKEIIRVNRLSQTINS